MNSVSLCLAAGQVVLHRNLFKRQSHLVRLVAARLEMSVRF